MYARHYINRFLDRLEQKFLTHNTIEVSKSTLLHNLDLFHGLTNQKIIPVLKANAYGHGIEEVASALRSKKLSYIAVDGYFEALRIRSVSRQPVLIMGAIRPENFATIKYDNFAFVVQDAATIIAIGKTGKKVKIHLECNTGMNRYGANKKDVTKLTKLILSHKNLNLEGVMTHLADSDGEEIGTVTNAVSEFDVCVSLVRKAGANPNIIHVAQTAGSIKAVSKYANTTRLGIGLYGINPFPKAHPLHKQLKDLQPVLTFKSTITRVHQLQKGDKVSYNYTFKAPKTMKIGVIPVGYYEGIDRSLSNKGFVKIGNNFAPIVGLVCMNHTMISLEGINARVGDEVIVYSNSPKDKNSVDRIATKYSLFSYSLLTSLNTNIRRRLIR